MYFLRPEVLEIDVKFKLNVFTESKVDWNSQ